MSKINLKVISLSFIFLCASIFLLTGCMGEKEELTTDFEGGEVTTQTPTEKYIVHVPEHEFEIELREMIDDLLQKHIGYSEVIAEERDEFDEMFDRWSWGYKLNSTMTQEDYLAFDTILDHENISYWAEGYDHGVSFEMYFNDFDKTVEDLNTGFSGMFKSSTGIDYLLSFDFDPDENILWVVKVM
jgi:hypothetical protein